RLQGDWSSDVCSSDLALLDGQRLAGAQPFQGAAHALVDVHARLPTKLCPRPGDAELRRPADQRDGITSDVRRSLQADEVADDLRSEERRVGKEGRCRW